jgi:hypothetical protein
MFCEDTKVSNGNSAMFGAKDSTLEENFTTVVDPEVG